MFKESVQNAAAQHECTLRQIEEASLIGRRVGTGSDYRVPATRRMRKLKDGLSTRNTILRWQNRNLGFTLRRHGNSCGIKSHLLAWCY